MKSIMIAGPGRCGSHWLFNLCQDAFGLVPVNSFHGNPYPDKVHRVLESYKKVGGRLCVTHYPLSVASQFVPYCTMLVAVRDPRDMIVSAALYQNQRDGRDYDTVMRKLLDRGHQMSWFEDFLDNYEKVSHFLVRYEDLHQDTPGMIQRIGDVVGIPVSDELAKNIADSNTIQEHHKKDPVMFRKGKVGGWTEYLLQEQAEKIVTLYKTFLDVVYPEGLIHV